MVLTADQREWLTLALVPGVGTVHFIRLLARFRTPGEVLQVSESGLREVVGKKLAQRIAHYRTEVDVDSQERAIAEHGVSLVTLNDVAYPPRLAEIYDPPLLLFTRGTLVERDEFSVALVGTRKATAYGIRTARKLGCELAARGITVVSGMALGIDTAAHLGALEAGGRTMAVLGCGVDIVYPRDNAELMHQITESGCVVSQFPMGVKPSPGHFPYRNRIISGITLGTVVVQAPIRSGALITAHRALEQGREVFAIPGEIGNKTSEGPHALIREGAKLVETVEDILLELNVPTEIAVQVLPPAPAPSESVSVTSAPSVAQVPDKPEPETASVQERDVLSVLASEGSFVDEIAAACRISVSQALSSLTMLELKGLVKQFSGKRFARR